MAHRVPDELRHKFTEAGQGHVFSFVDSRKVTDGQAADLVAQLENIDVALVNDLFRETMAASATATAPVASRLAPCVDVTKLSAAKPWQRQDWEDAGFAAIGAGIIAALTLAGGQGTRLGFDRPKGEYDIGLPSHKSLFQLQAERILRLKDVAAQRLGRPAATVSLPWVVMTSPMTDADTRAYLSKNEYFGLPPSEVLLFSQGTLPCLDFDGKIILETGWRVAEAPDGNGGIYRALHLSGVISDLKTRGIVGVHVFAVDNAVVKVADPVFVGYCLAAGADVGNKVCPKAGPHERVGVLCLRDGAHTVVEYSEMDAATAELVDPATGALAFNAGNICIHYYSVSFLDTACAPAALPKVYHIAKKSIPSAHPETGQTLTKGEMAGRGSTGIKLESFIFDVFPAAAHMAVLEVQREDEFAPVKNAPGSAEDSPDTARALVLAQHGRWLAAAGMRVAAGSGVAEVSPLVSYGGEQLAAALEGVVTELPAGPALIVSPPEAALPMAVAAAAAGVHVVVARRP